MRFRPTLSAAILGSTLLGASLLLMAADDSHPPPPANPEYAQWARFKPGTYVTLERKILEHRDANVGVVEAMAHPPGGTVMRINTKLIDLNKDKAVLEETRIDLGEGSETEMPADKVTIFANGEISNASDTMWEASSPKPSHMARGRSGLSWHDKLPDVDLHPALPAGSKQRLAELGPQRFARWLRESPAVGVTDTTFRDAHRSLLATRVRTSGLIMVAPAHPRGSCHSCCRWSAGAARRMTWRCASSRRIPGSDWPRGAGDCPSPIGWERDQG